MTGMQLYARFVFTLSIGLLGLGMVLTRTLETILHEWDAPRELNLWWRRLTQCHSHAADVRAEDILIELTYKERRYERRSSAGSIGRRRKAMREVREAEDRLASPHAA
ncbi:MAG: hypothetical protein A2X37_09490 [Elusimicrobia bacterium GWA2_66_18]|nr:MAG: hypothetical protein A2X37_09490 [Elusimicrobia bacterium GWA2_66_18]